MNVIIKVYYCYLINGSLHFKQTKFTLYPLRASKISQPSQDVYIGRDSIVKAIQANK